MTDIFLRFETSAEGVEIMHFQNSIKQTLETKKIHS